MIQVVFVLCIIVPALSMNLVEETEYYKVYALSEDDLRLMASQGKRESFDGKTVVERPFNGFIPPDNGGNYGDLTFSPSMVRKNGTLIARDTIINSNSDSARLITYERQFDNTFIEDFQLLNFGRQRGFARNAEIYHASGYVIAEILVRPNNFIRMFVEVYKRP